MITITGEIFNGKLRFFRSLAKYVVDFFRLNKLIKLMKGIFFQIKGHFLCHK